MLGWKNKIKEKYISKIFQSVK